LYKTLKVENRMTVWAFWDVCKNKRILWCWVALVVSLSQNCCTRGKLRKIFGWLGGVLW
jgi:hypothetical protein